MQLIKITKEGKISQLINPMAINSISKDSNDPHGNNYTEIVLNQGSIKVEDSLETIWNIIESQDFEQVLTEYNYKFEITIL